MADWEARARAFAAHLRDPDAAPAPPDLDPRRVQVYRELFYNNVQTLLAGNFPVIRKLHDDASWHALVRAFFAGHASHTPLFPELGREFHRFLERRAADGAGDPPWLAELAHYEWVELAVSIDEAEIDAIAHDPAGDVVAGHPVVSPVAWPLVYRWPVHRIRPDFRPTEPPAEPTCLIVARNRRDEVAFIAATPLTLRLIESVKENPAWTGRDCIGALAELFPPAEQATATAAATALMHDLRARDVLLGTRP